MLSRRSLLLAVAASLAMLGLRDARSGESAAADEQLLKAAGVGIGNQALVDYFRKHSNDNDRNRIAVLIRQLGDNAFDARKRASVELVAFGTLAEPQLRQALLSADLEIVRRAEECLRQLRRSPEAQVPAAAARLMGRRKPPGAAEVLLQYLPFVEDDGIAVEVRSVLASVAVRDGKVDPALVQALADKSPVRRGAAAEALARAGAISQGPAIHSLLQDPEPTVRLQAAVALAAARNKEVVPVLIELLDQLPLEEGRQAEDILLQLAQDQAPPVALGTDDALRRRCRQAWTAWWADQGAKVDMAKYNPAARVLGYTAVLFLDEGRMMELGPRGILRRQIDGLDYPLDLQLLPDEHILVAEHGNPLNARDHPGGRVTERDRRGEVVWEKKVEEPLVAQRLPNGHTFIATNTQLLEVDQAGKEVFSHFPRNGEFIMKAVKLPNGEIACVESAYRFVRLDAVGREIKSFTVGVRTSGGRIDVLPNGHVLAPEYRNNKVVEYDADGKPVWQVEVEEPIAAVRLRTGNTLITSMHQQRAIEVDRTGKVVWEYRGNKRVTRAFRR